MSGHINEDSLRKQNAAAIKAAELEPFVPNSLRHTCLTHRAGSGMDAFTLMRLAAHSNIATTQPYVHVNDDQARRALPKAWDAEVGTNPGTLAQKSSRTDFQWKAA